METGRLAAQVDKAISALITHEDKLVSLSSSNKAKANTILLNEDEHEHIAVYILLGLNKMSEKVSLKPIRLPIPYPFRRAEDENLSVCLFTKDPQRYYKDLITSLSLPAINKIQGISKLCAKFKPFEAKRNLCGSFDFFLADSRIIPMLPKIIGKAFFTKKRQPVSVRLENVQLDKLKKELRAAIESTYYFQTGGPNLSIRVGKLSQDKAHISANVEAVLRLLAKKLPEGLSSIRSIHLKTHSSVALPIFIRQASSSKSEPENQ